MNDCHTSKLLVDYLDEELDFTQSEKVKSHLNNCNSCKERLQELSILFSAFQNENKLPSPSSLDAGFYEMLQNEKNKNYKLIDFDSENRQSITKRKYKILKIAASIVLLLSSFMFGKYHQLQTSKTNITLLKNESLELKKASMLSLLESKSASSRIQGINYMNEFSSADKAIVMAIIEKMEFDENTNVRIAAAEGLSSLTNIENVKKTFISLLKKEIDPRIQIIIIDALLKIEDTNFTMPIQSLFEREDTHPFVKEHIKATLPTKI